MNEEFLYRLRREPPPEFAARLKARLDLQAEAFAHMRRASMVRTLVMALLIGGSTVAATLLVVRGAPSVMVDFFGVPGRSSIATDVPKASHPAVAQGVKISKDYIDRTTAPVPEQVTSQPMPGSDRTSTSENGTNIAEPLTPESTVAAAAQRFTSVATAQPGRDYISIVSSSLIYPLTKTVAAGRFSTSKVERLDTGAGLRVFCKGIGVQHADIIATSRRIRDSEFDTCVRNGVDHIVEAKIGYQAVVLTRAKMGHPLTLSGRDIYLALAKEIPDPFDPTKLIKNPNVTWNQVNPALEYQTIEIFGPPSDSPKRDAFIELVLEAGCESYSWIKTLKEIDETRYKRICHTLREDGVYVEAEQNGVLITQTLWANPGAVAVLGYNFYERNKDQLLGSLLEGADPTFATVVAGTYPASSSLYLYVKTAHVAIVPGLRQFAAEYLNEHTYGELIRGGLIPLDEAERRAIRANVLGLKELKL